MSIGSRIGKEARENFADLAAGMRPLSEVAKEALQELKTPYPAIPIALWPRFTEVTGGLRTKEFSILCGSTGTGKTTFLANLSAQLLIQGVKHFVASVETGDTDFVKRVMSVLLEQDINRGDALGPAVVADIESRWKNTFVKDDLMLSLFSDRVALPNLLIQLRVAHERYGCQVAFLDNLNFFMEVTAAKDQIVAMDHTIHELIMFCKVVPMHVVMVMHPKKTEHGRVESEFDIKGSSTAVQEAHNVFLFNRPELGSNYDQKKDRELKIAKLRRRGEHVGRRLIFESHGTCYFERDLL